MPSSRFVGIVLLGALAFTSGVGRAQVCTAPLAAVGPIDPVNGFPRYYIDSTGLALQPCLSALCDPALATPQVSADGTRVIFDPALPVSFPTNFPSELFYFRAISRIDTLGGSRVTLVLALEGSFATNGDPLPGDQVVFARTRATATAGLLPNTRYRMTHPYGSFDAITDATGAFRGVGIDIGLIPGVFTTALNGNVGPFLQGVPVPGIVPLPGQIGNPGFAQQVTGSLCNQNFFRIEAIGANGQPIAGTAVQTSDFSTIIGLKAAICGNGLVDVGEQCDDGNAVGGDCCSATCQFEAAGAPCTPATPNPCLTGTTCNGAGSCAGGTPTAISCTDGNACTTADTCAGGVCVGGAAPNCDDLNPCTTDTCAPATGCVHTPNTLPCDDGSACTTADACAGGACVGGPAPNCNDGNPCTTDGCLPASGCFHTPNTAPCSDGNLCTVGDACAGGVCVPGATPASCDDLNPCTTDSCAPASGCLHVANTLPCDDGNACTPNDTCTSGICLGGAAPTCNDNNTCTTDSCDPATGNCVNQPNTLPCTDGNACTIGDVCANGVCAGTLIPCTPTAVVGSVVADVTVDSSLPGSNLGTKTQLNVDAGPTVKRTFLRVQVTGVGGQHVTAARLNLKAASTTNANSVSGGQIHRISNCTWGETTTTYNNQPAIDGAVLSTIGAVALGQTIAFDLTSAITGDGTYCFAIDSASTDGVDYLSREASSGKPTLTITAACACGQTCTPTTCAAQGKNCGSMSDGCGGTLTCGSCTSPQTCGGSGVANVCGTATATAPTASVVADVSVDSSLPTSNLGSRTQLNVDAGPAVKRTFVRVQVGNVGARTVTSAQLNLKVATTSNAQSIGGGQIHRVADCAWSESAVNFNNQPALDPAVLSSLGAVALGQAVSFDLTGAITGDGTYCFGIDSLSTDGVDYNSREASTVSNRPTVALTVAP